MVREPITVKFLLELLMAQDKVVAELKRSNLMLRVALESYLSADLDGKEPACKAEEAGSTPVALS